MPTRNVNLTGELDRLVSAKIESGRYENASEVVRAALRILEREEQQHEAKLAAPRVAIDEGDASGVVERDPFERVRQQLKLPKKERRRPNSVNAWRITIRARLGCDHKCLDLRKMESGL